MLHFMVSFVKLTRFPFILYPLAVSFGSASTTSLGGLERFSDRDVFEFGRAVLRRFPVHALVHACTPTQMGEELF